jgi:hypothetical protein
MLNNYKYQEMLSCIELILDPPYPLILTLLNKHILILFIDYLIIVKIKLIHFQKQPHNIIKHKNLQVITIPIECNQFEIYQIW